MSQTAGARTGMPRPWLAWRMTAVAPTTRMLRSAGSPARVITPSRVLPAVE